MEKRIWSTPLPGDGSFADRVRLTDTSFVNSAPALMDIVPPGTVVSTVKSC